MLEMVRFGASELHLIAALMGGIAAQVRYFSSVLVFGLELSYGDFPVIH